MKVDLLVQTVFARNVSNCISQNINDFCCHWVYICMYENVCITSIAEKQTPVCLRYKNKNFSCIHSVCRHENVDTIVICWNDQTLDAIYIFTIVLYKVIVSL